MRRGSTSRNSTTEPGQPWTSSSGTACGDVDRAWSACRAWPSTTVADVLVAAELGLDAPPVVGVAPPVEQVAEEVELGALRPADPVDLVREPGAVEPRLEVVQGGVRDLDPERLEGQRHQSNCAVGGIARSSSAS